MADHQTKYISDQTKRRNLMNTNIQRIIGNFWFWLGFSLLLIVAALAIKDVSRRATIIPNTGSPIQAQAVPEAAVQSVTDYLRVHSNPSAQAVPDAAVQSVADYLQMHSSSSAQAVPDASVQSVADYIRLHSNDLTKAVITDPAAQSVMDYLKAHGIQP
jgi:hypothetical protein